MSFRPGSSAASKPSSLTPARTLKEVLSVTTPSQSVDVCLVKPSSNPNDANSTCNDLKTIRKDRLGPPKKMLLDVPRKEQSEMKDDERPDSPSSMRPTPAPKQPAPQLTQSTSMEVDLGDFKGPTQVQENEIMNNVFKRIDSTPITFVPDVVDPESARGGEAASVASAYAIAELMHEFGVMDDELYEDANYVSGALLAYLASDRNKQTQTGEDAPNAGTVQPMDISASYAKGESVSGVLSKEDKEKMSRHVYKGGEGLVTTALKVKFEGIINSYKSMVDNFKQKSYISALKDASLLTAKTVSMIGANTLAAAGVPKAFDLGKLPGGDRIKDLQKKVGDKIPSGFLERKNKAVEAIAGAGQPSWPERFIKNHNPANWGQLKKTPSSFQSFVDSLWMLDYVAGPHVRIAIYAAVTVLQVLDNYGRNNLGSIRKFLAANTVEDFSKWMNEIEKAIKDKLITPEKTRIETTFERRKSRIPPLENNLKQLKKRPKQLQTELELVQGQIAEIEGQIGDAGELRNEEDRLKDAMEEVEAEIKALEDDIETRKSNNESQRKEDLARLAKDEAREKKWAQERRSEFKKAFDDLKEYVRLQTDKKNKEDANFDRFEWGEGTRFAFEMVRSRFGTLRGISSPVEQKLEVVNDLFVLIQEYMDAREITDDDLKAARVAIDTKKGPPAGRAIPQLQQVGAQDSDEDDDDANDDNDGVDVGLGNARVVD